MVDTRFHSCAGPMPLSDLLSAAGHEALSPGERSGTLVEGAGDLAEARSTEIAFIADRRYLDALSGSRAGVIVASPEFADAAPQGRVVLEVEHAQDTFLDLLAVLYPKATGNAARRLAAAPTGVDPSARIEADVTVGAGAIVAAGAEIGEGTVIGPNVVVGPGVAIGRGSIVGAGVSLECALVGDRVTILPGARIGTESFGFLPRADGHRKVPQLGRVIIQNDVQIGANTVVDRGTLSDTVIGEGTKIGNLAQIAHNVRIGRNCMFVGTTAFAGTVTVGDNVTFGGAVRVVGFVHIGEGSTIQADTLVTKSCPPNSRLAGTPARDVRQWRREMAAVARLGRDNSK